MKDNQNNINNRIRAREVRVIDQDGNNLGVISIGEALNKAREAGMDLVEMSSGGGIPVCRIIDYNKYLYDQKAKAKKSRTKKVDLKEFKIGPNTSEGDLRVRIDRGKEFLSQGNVVKYTVVFKGREAAFPEIGKTKLKIIESELSEVGKSDGDVKHMGKIMMLTISPKK
jgi:translation initiation factor IF-3